MTINESNNLDRNSHLKNKSLLSLHAASFLFGITALFSKTIALPSSDITAYRSIVAVFVLFLLLSLRKQSKRLKSSKHYFFMLIGGILLGAHWITYFHAMQVSSVAVGMVALFTHPVITVFLEPLFQGKRPHRLDVICAVFVSFGVYLMVPSFSLDNHVTLGITFGVISAVFFSSRNVIQRHYLAEYGGEVSILYQSFIAALVALPFITAAPETLTANTFFQLCILGAFFTALPHTLFASSLSYLNAKTASLVSCLQPVYGSMFALLVFQEYPNWSTVLGGSIIILAAAWESYRA